MTAGLSYMTFQRTISGGGRSLGALYADLAQVEQRAIDGADRGCATKWPLR